MVGGGGQIGGHQEEEQQLPGDPQDRDDEDECDQDLYDDEWDEDTKDDEGECHNTAIGKVREQSQSIVRGEHPIAFMLPTVSLSDVGSETEVTFLTF